MLGTMFIYHLIQSPQPLWEVDVIIISILIMRKLRLRHTKQLAWSHKAK